MSRIGKKPIAVPSGVDVKVSGSNVSVKGPLGKLDWSLAQGVGVAVDNGQIVVARIDEEVTVKRFLQHGSIVRLLPENPAYDPIRIDLKNQPLVIEGLAVGVLRKEI